MIATPVNVTFPVFVAVNVYVITSPTASNDAGSAVFTRAMPGSCVPGTDSSSVPVTSGPVGGVPVAVAALSTDPASRSACVITYSAVQTSCSPGASVTGCAQSSADRPGSGSVIDTPVSVTLPVFVAVNV